RHPEAPRSHAGPPDLSLRRRLDAAGTRRMGRGPVPRRGVGRRGGADHGRVHGLRGRPLGALQGLADPSPEALMTASRVRRHVELIIGAETTEAAHREAERLGSALAHSDFHSTLTRMIARELEANGKSRRFSTLTRLSEYCGAVTRNALRAGLSADEP